jgi:uncharacterized integral membrane protein
MDNGTHDDEFRIVEDAPRAAPVRPVPVIPDEPGFLRRNMGGILWGIVLVLLAIFIGQNWNDVRMNVYFWTFTTKLSFALIAAALLGVSLGWLVPALARRRSRRDRDRDQV